MAAMEDDQQQELVEGFRPLFYHHPMEIIQMRNLDGSYQTSFMSNRQTVQRERSLSPDTYQEGNDEEDRTVIKEGLILSQDVLGDNLGTPRKTDEALFSNDPTFPEHVASQPKVWNRDRLQLFFLF